MWEIISIPTTRYGMVRAALAPVPVVNSTTLRGSVYKQLNQTTTGDIEIRTMGSTSEGYSLEDEDTPVQLIAIFIQ
jgi:hypothetical protein